MYKGLHIVSASASLDCLTAPLNSKTGCSVCPCTAVERSLQTRQSHALKSQSASVLLQLQCRVCSAVSDFLAEAVVSVKRRPHELFESALEASCAMGASPAAEASKLDSPKRGLAGGGCMLLAVAALQQAVRVLGSEKMLSAPKAAIAAYVAGECWSRFVVADSKIPGLFSTAVFLSVSLLCDCEVSREYT